MRNRAWRLILSVLVCNLRDYWQDQLEISVLFLTFSTLTFWIGESRRVKNKELDSESQALVRVVLAFLDSQIGLDLFGFRICKMSSGLARDHFCAFNHDKICCHKLEDVLWHLPKFELEGLPGQYHTWHRPFIWALRLFGHHATTVNSVSRVLHLIMPGLGQLSNLNSTCNLNSGSGSATHP